MTRAKDGVSKNREKIMGKTKVWIRASLGKSVTAAFRCVNWLFGAESH